MTKTQADFEELKKKQDASDLIRILAISQFPEEACIKIPPKLIDDISTVLTIYNVVNQDKAKSNDEIKVVGRMQDY
uniref:Uncharacterized protein n=1 Tax=Leersia perrieri TaxID=77586 RepID=A0A0D9WZH3_9ORYZ